LADKHQQSSPAFLVSGTHSGVGKTTISLVLMAALRDRGYRVQPFKVGPDFIDTAYHKLAAAQTSINLDLWMMGLGNIRKSFSAGAARADVSVVEGMGALFDGENGTRERGSSGFLSRKLGIPVVLVVDIWGMTRSTLAILDGFLRFDPRVQIAGVIFNRAGSRRHYEMVYRSLPARLKKSCLGYVLEADRLAIPERHLGLLTVEENEANVISLNRYWREAARTLDIDAVVKSFGIKKKAGPTAHLHPKPPAKVRLGVAKDKAFCFYYAENLLMLEEAGAELCYFSPTEGSGLPSALDGLYIGGGYPESFAPQLSGHKGMREQVQAAAKEGMPIYAECGGLMYLGRTLKNFDGASYPMASVLPLDVIMDKSHLAIKYIKLRTLVPTPIGPPGTQARGQEFHQSRIPRRRDTQPPPYRVTTSTGDVYTEGFIRKNVLGSYIHLHFMSNPLIPQFFVRKCLEYKDLRRR
jgi:cobyrinic acid a,c-diamide synthase